MRRTASVLAVLFLTFVLSTPACAQLNTMLPFLHQEVGDYYIKSRVLDPSGYLGSSRYADAIVEMYVRGDVGVSRSELFGEVFEFSLDMDTWTPETDLELFYDNYEVRIVGMEKAAGRHGFVVELYHKSDQQLKQRYVIDQEKGLVLNQYTYDLAGNLIQGYEAVEVDFDPDFSAIDWEHIQFEITMEHQPLSKDEFKKLLPWINLESLPLPGGFAISAYSEVDSAWYHENRYLQENYPNLPADAYWIWVSDGFEVIVIEVFTIQGSEIILKSDSYLDVVESLPGVTVIVLPGQPATVNIQGSSLTLHQIENIILALTGAREIRNLEALDTLSIHSQLPDVESIDYASLPLEPVSKQELLRLNPWMSMSSNRASGFLVTGLWKTTYPEKIKERFALHQEHPNLNLIDLVVELSDGERVHYISVSFALDFHREPLLGGNINYGVSLNGFELLAQGPLLSVYSESTFLSIDDQLTLVGELFPMLGIPDRR